MTLLDRYVNRLGYSYIIVCLRTFTEGKLILSKLKLIKILARFLQLHLSNKVCTEQYKGSTSRYYYGPYCGYGSPSIPKVPRVKPRGPPVKTCHPSVISKKKILMSEDSSDLWTSLNKLWVDNFPQTFRQNLRPYRQKYSQCAENSTLKSRVISQNNIIEKSTANLSEQTVNNIEVKLEQSDDFDIQSTSKSSVAISSVDELNRASIS